MTDTKNTIVLDWQRQDRTAVPEVVFAESKSSEQLIEIARQVLDRGHRMLFTRVRGEQAELLCKKYQDRVRYHADSSTLIVGAPLSQGEAAESAQSPSARIAIVAAGSSDAPVVAEIEQTLLFLGHRSQQFVDVGVAGLWRLTRLAPELRTYSVVIAVAGMEGALFSVLGGLVEAPIIAVPTSVGYGVGSGGQVALHAALCGCSPGLAVVNIDNGFGAAVLAVKMLRLQLVDVLV